MIYLETVHVKKISDYLYIYLITAFFAWLSFVRLSINLSVYLFICMSTNLNKYVAD